MDAEQVFVLIACESPEMRETLDGGFFIWSAMGVERTFDGLSELIGEIFAEAYYQIDDFGMHMRVVQ